MIQSTSGRNLSMSLKIKLEKFTGDGTQYVNAWVFVSGLHV